MKLQSLGRWMQEHLQPTDGPGAGKPLRLERWQRLFLAAVEREKRSLVTLQAATQTGKTMLGSGIAMRAAVDGAGAMWATAGEPQVRDASRRLERLLEHYVGDDFDGPASGPGTRKNWRLRIASSGGWVALASAGSAQQLCARTAQVAIADETARWPQTVRGGEGHGLQLLRQRISDWHEDGRLISISSPTHSHDAVCLSFNDGDRRRLEYVCPGCTSRIPFRWEQVAGVEKGQVPMIACGSCGTLHDERARRRMLRTAKWIPQVEADDEDAISFQLGRLDSARASLIQITREFRRARRAVERGDPRALATFTNTVNGLPAAMGSVDLDKLMELRGSQPADQVEQVVASVDVQDDRVYFVVAGFTAGNTEVQVLAHEELRGDPRDAGTWTVLAAALERHHTSCVAVDAGFLPSVAREQAGKRRWWIPVVGRAGGAGRPIASAINRRSGIATMGADEAATWWSGRVQAGRVHVPKDIDRRQLAELAAAEVLVAEGGALRWRPIPGRRNDRWDCAKLATFARHFRPLTASRRTLRLVSL